MNPKSFILKVYALQIGVDFPVSTVLSVPCNDLGAAMDSVRLYLDRLFPSGYTITFIETANFNKVSDSNTYVHG